MKRGTVKRMKGEIRKHLDIYQVEHHVYERRNQNAADRNSHKQYDII